MITIVIFITPKPKSSSNSTILLLTSISKLLDCL